MTGVPTQPAVPARPDRGPHHAHRVRPECRDILESASMDSTEDNVPHHIAEMVAGSVG